MSASVASVDVQVSVTVSPLFTMLGAAFSVTVGCAADGAGGVLAGGVVATCFLQPPTNTNTASVPSKSVSFRLLLTSMDCLLRGFTSYSAVRRKFLLLPAIFVYMARKKIARRDNAPWKYGCALRYLGDQFGDSFWPSYVNSRGKLPSASMDQICRVPVRVDSNTRCRPSGAQLGRSLRPASRVNSTSCRLTMSII